MVVSNISTLNMLGCSLKFDNLMPYLIYPSLSQQVYATNDICHMLELAGNVLAEMGPFLTESDDKISWEYIDSR